MHKSETEILSGNNLPKCIQKAFERDSNNKPEQFRILNKVWEILMNPCKHDLQR